MKAQVQRRECLESTGVEIGLAKKWTQSRQCISVGMGAHDAGQFAKATD